jgi:hypothetical protein
VAQHGNVLSMLRVIWPWSARWLHPLQVMR